jgi:uncharacterized protein (UPF0332 family)
LLSAKILNKNNLYENSVSESYYAMYNSLHALLFRYGIKCENHTLAIEFMDLLFGEKEIRDTVLKAKKERIDKQYYLTDEINEPLTEEISLEMIKNAEEVLNQIRILISEIENINEIKEKFEKIYNNNHQF